MRSRQEKCTEAQRTKQKGKTRDSLSLEIDYILNLTDTRDLEAVDNYNRTTASFYAAMEELPRQRELASKAQAAASKAQEEAKLLQKEKQVLEERLASSRSEKMI